VLANIFGTTGSAAADRGLTLMRRAGLALSCSMMARLDQRGLRPWNLGARRNAASGRLSKQGPDREDQMPRDALDQSRRQKRKDSSKRSRYGKESEKAKVDEDKKCWKEFEDVEWMGKCTPPRNKQSSTGTKMPAPRIASLRYKSKTMGRRGDKDGDGGTVGHIGIGQRAAGHTALTAPN
jgi:hypothetical protein